MRLFAATIAAAFLSVPPASAEEAKAPANSLAVMDTVAQGVPESMAALVNEKLIDYAKNALAMDVIGKADVRNLIGLEAQKQLLGCDSEKCLGANVGDALGVELLLTSTVGRIGDRFQLSVTVLEVGKAKIRGRGTREVRSENELVENARDLAHFALKGEQRESKGYLRVDVGLPAAKVIIDGELHGLSPLAGPVRVLAGRHTVRVEKEGFIPLEGAAEVEAGKEAVIEVKLIPKKDIKLAGAGYLPWAGAAAGVAVVAGGLSGWFYYDAKQTYETVYLREQITKSELDAAKKDIEFKGNTLHYYSAWTSGVMGGVSVALFSAYFLSGLGAGGDEPGADAPGISVEPTADGFAVRF